MPWRLLAFILAMTLVLVFIGFNLENRCDVSLAFHTFTDVPVIITILASFLFGLLMAFPLSFVRRSGKHNNRGRHGSGIQRGVLGDEQGPSFGAGASPSRSGGHRTAPSENSFDQD
jgi:uncharacterized integral membrane protein